LIFDSSNIVSGKKILNGFKGVKINGTYVKEMVGSHRIDDNITAVAVFFENGNATLIQPSSVNCWLPVNVEDGSFVKSICPVYNVKGSVICITTDGSLKRFSLENLTNRNVNTTTTIENCVFVPDGYEDSSILLVNKDGLCSRIKVSDVPLKGRTSQGVLSSYDSGVGIHMTFLKSIKGVCENSHYVILLENKKLGDGYVYARDIEDIKVGSRSAKLKKLFDFNDFTCTGISSVNLGIKEQVGLFISENSTSSLKTSNLKNLKTPRKINCRAFDFIGIEVS
jgi:DNA gyrase/topoisomerase IV subunit A